MEYAICIKSCPSVKLITGHRLFTLCVAFLLFSQNLFAASMDDCLLEALKNADASATAGQLRNQCQEEVLTHNTPAVTSPKNDNRTAIEKRTSEDRGNVLQPFTLMAHRPNYILPGAYNIAGYDATVAYQQQFDAPATSTDNTEAQFQISVKVPLMVNLFEHNIDLYAAYTNHSFWQLYNDSSAPFRETNHEPEAWLQLRLDLNFFGFTNTVNVVGFNHQSNGRGGVLSRSWNRIYGNFVFGRGNFVMSFRPWYRIPEEADVDDNSDLTDYLGHYELRAAYKWEEHVFQVMSRNNLESGFDSGAVEVTWSFPLGDYQYLKGYVQYFSGYGESLIDYDNYVNRIGIGFAVTDWL